MKLMGNLLFVIYSLSLDPEQHMSVDSACKLCNRVEVLQVLFDCLKRYESALASVNVLTCKLIFYSETVL